MEELSNVGLKMFFDEEIYLIDKINSDTLIVPEPVTKTSVAHEPDMEPVTLSYKGGNNKGIVIIGSEESHEFFRDADEILLLNILKAIGLSISDVAIINQHTSGANWQDQLEFTKVIAFGVDSSSYDLTTEKYSIHIHQNIKWLFSDSLASLSEDKALKGKLWGKLQELF